MKAKKLFILIGFVSGIGLLATMNSFGKNSESITVPNSNLLNYERASLAVVVDRRGDQFRHRSIRARDNAQSRSTIREREIQTVEEVRKLGATPLEGEQRQGNVQTRPLSPRERQQQTAEELQRLGVTPPEGAQRQGNVQTRPLSPRERQKQAKEELQRLGVTPPEGAQRRGNVQSPLSPSEREQQTAEELRRLGVTP